MPIKIHHGPPGSYKTAGAMGDDFLREARAGRTIVTNVRGVSRERTLEEFPDLPDSFDVIWVDDKDDSGRKKWAEWFQWVPQGAFIFLDEAQDLWPKRWKEADIRSLDYPGGLKKALSDNRPFCWEQAFDKHRHYGWDMVLTTPKYSKIRDDVRGVAEMSYKHKNLAVIGWAGRYIEAVHLADDDGGAPSHFLSVNRKKVPPYVFRLYDSTATGQITDTKTGINILKNPRISFLLLCIGVALFFILRNGVPKPLGGSGSAPVASSSPGVGGSASPGAAPSGVAGRGAGAGNHASAGGVGPFEGESVYITMAINIRDKWRYVVSYAGTEFTSGQIEDMGYSLKTFGSCGVQIKRGEWSRFVTCGQNKDRPPVNSAPVLADVKPSVPVMDMPPAQLKPIVVASASP